MAAKDQLTNIFTNIGKRIMIATMVDNLSTNVYDGIS